MIQMESKVQVADNTGARVAKMIGVLGKRTRVAGIGDIITAHIREAGGDRSAVTGGTTVLSDWLVVRVTQEEVIE